MNEKHTSTNTAVRNPEFGRVLDGLLKVFLAVARCES